jgi:hypothetical protein
VRLSALGIFADDATFALHHYVLVATRQFRRQSNLKLNTRPDVKRRVPADVHTRRAHIASRASLLNPLNLDWQFQRKSFSSSRFGGHKPSSERLSHCAIAGLNELCNASVDPMTQ